MTFTAGFPIRFAHCDMAGIAYYPRLLELCDAAIEQWCADVLHVPRATMHGDLALAMPTVELTINFAAPCRLGERLDIAVAVTALGRTSLNLVLDGSCAGAPRFRIRLVQVLTGNGTIRPRPWPEDWRRRIVVEDKA